jgi:putrescine transport system ATP-binding protein
MSHEPPAADIPAEPLLAVRRLAKSYGATAVLHDVDFGLAAGETLAILGDSGCGKTTLLRILAGLIRETSGEVVLSNRRLNDVAPKDRGIVYLDQEPLLFEHLTVRDNIAFAPRLQGRPAAETDAAVDEILAAIGLAAHAGKREWQLSGGQKQRVAFARAVLARPQVLLLDEPFSSLDGRTRGAMRELFQSLSERYALTSLFVTHDVKEALMIGDRFSLMSEGRLRVYPDRATFVRDEETGIPREMSFWREESSES